MGQREMESEEESVIPTVRMKESMKILKIGAHKGNLQMKKTEIV